MQQNPLARAGSAFEFHGRRRIRALSELMSKVGNLNRNAGEGVAISQVQRDGRPERLLPTLERRR
jgi:hypothetical protein